MSNPRKLEMSEEMAHAIAASIGLALMLLHNDRAREAFLSRLSLSEKECFIGSMGLLVCTETPQDTLALGTERFSKRMRSAVLALASLGRTLASDNTPAEYDGRRDEAPPCNPRFN